MPRWSIVRTLLYKEFLRYRYNWGLLVMVAFLLTLSGLVAISSRVGRVPLSGGANLTRCQFYYSSRGGEKLGQLIRDVRSTPPPEGYEIEYRDVTPSVAPPAQPQLTPDELAIAVFTPDQASRALENGSHDAWQIRYSYLGLEQPASLPIYREWFMQAAQKSLNVQPRLEEKTIKAKALRGIEVKDRVSLIVTALVLFSLYLLSFNLYLNSTGEEREKKVLLAVLLTPATAGEIVSAKAIFYGIGSLIVSAAIVAMYKPEVLAEGYFWILVSCGSLAYVSIGTILVTMVRRQSTISTVSMMYLIGTAIIMLLAETPGLRAVFIPLRLMLIEHYLHSQTYALLTDQTHAESSLRIGTLEVSRYLLLQVMMSVITGAWFVAAVIVFGRKSMTLAQAR
jgi:hypothetical protein